MSDIWLAIAEEGRPTSSSSSSSPPLSDRAAARASRPRPWVQSQTRVKSQTPLTSKADTDLAASIAAAEARLAARRDERRQNAAAQSALDTKRAETRRKFEAISLNRRRLRTEKMLLQLDRLLPESDSPRVEYPPLDAYHAARLANHCAGRPLPSVRTQIPAPVGSIARERKLLCPCGKEFCVYRQHRVIMNARDIARREQEAAELAAEKAEREKERLSRLNQPRDFLRRMRKLERLANDMAEQLGVPTRLCPSVEQEAGHIRTGPKFAFTRRSRQAVVVQPTVPNQPRGILRKPGQKNTVAKTVSFSHFECKETEKWIGDLDVATGTPADQCLTDDGEPIADSRHIHVHVARPSSPRPASQARFGFGAAYPPSMVMRRWKCVDAEEKLYGRVWRG